MAKVTNIIQQVTLWYLSYTNHHKNRTLKMTVQFCNPVLIPLTTSYNNPISWIPFPFPSLKHFHIHSYLNYPWSHVWRALIKAVVLDKVFPALAGHISLAAVVKVEVVWIGCVDHLCYFISATWPLLPWGTLDENKLILYTENMDITYW